MKIASRVLFVIACVMGAASVLSALLFTAGLLMFSLNICLIHLADITVFRALTPYGGMAFVAGWLALASWAWRLQAHKAV